ncbi:MAG: cupin domain-containing protein [Anaerolineales bacterium]
MANGPSSRSAPRNHPRKPYRRAPTAAPHQDHADEASVGQRLRQIRAGRGLSLRELARASSLNVNTLSAIENERTSPSVSTLQQVAHCLRVPMSDFFQPPQQDLDVVYQQDAQRPHISFEHGLLQDLASGMRRLGTEPLILTLSKRSDSGKTPIVHTGREFVYCLEGSVRYVVDGREYVLEPGDSLVFEAYLPHRWINSNKSRSQVLLVLCPTDTRDSAKERHFLR